ncbi:MAG: hypothetical protein KJ000_03540 [Pirellulaceae bacterium]|nr:hypothetical protein [Pirellulaceae bacterium]
MGNLCKNLWRDESASVNSAELVLIMTLLSIGSLVGMKSMRDSVVTEFADMAQAIANLDQTYSYSAITVVWDGGTLTTAGSFFLDAPDFCDTPGTVQHEQTEPGSKCINVAQPASSSTAGGETGF